MLTQKHTCTHAVLLSPPACITHTHAQVVYGVWRYSRFINAFLASFWDKNRCGAVCCMSFCMVVLVLWKSAQVCMQAASLDAQLV